MAMRYLVLLLAVVFSGCTALRSSENQNPLPHPASAEEALQRVNAFARQGRWGDAVKTLDIAIRRFPGEPGLLTRKQSVLAQQERQRRYLADRILVSDAENQARQIILLEKLSLVDAESLVLLSRRLYWQEKLNENLERLVECAEFHAGYKTTLARKCYELADEQKPSSEGLQIRLDKVERKLRSIESEIAAKRRAKAQKKRQEKVKALLMEARQAIGNNFHSKALNILDQAHELEPDNIEVDALRQQARSMLKPQVEALIKVGDRLYLNDQLSAAVVTWQAALTLAPNDEEILARIERARSVMQRLETLREQQKDTPGGS